MSIALNSTIRVTDESTGHGSKIGTVTVIDSNSSSTFPYYVTGLLPDPEQGCWLRADQVEAVQDGQTLTVSSPFRAGETLLVHGRDDDYDGKEVTYLGYAEDSGRHAVMLNDNRLYFFERHLIRPLATDIVEPRPSEATGIITDLQAKVSRLNDELAVQARRATRAEERLTEQQRRYSHDMTAIQTIMREVKEEQDWCDDGWNEVVDRVNRELEGGFEFEKARELVKKSVSVRGETTVDIDVWVYEDDDENDTDNWLDEDGDEISDTDEYMQEALKAEYDRCGSQFDTVEVA